MTARTALLSLTGIAALAAGLLSMPACNVCTLGGSLPPGEPIELGVDVDLLDVANVTQYVGDASYERLAVGAEATVVVFGYDYVSHEYRPFVEPHALADLLGPVELRAAAVVATSWWVVGEAGAIVVSNNRGSTWDTIELPGIDAELRAITSFRDLPVIVGDEIVLARQADGTWLEVTPPVGGWGQLRAVGSLASERVYAAGLAGVVWSTDDPSGEWVAEDSGTTVDLLAIQSSGSNINTNYWESLSVHIVGGDGTWIEVTPDGEWIQRFVGVHTNIIDIDNGRVLDEHGGVHALARSNSSMAIETIEGARALVFDRHIGISTVGLGGLATTPPIDGC